jgi:hypothetical protein
MQDLTLKTEMDAPVVVQFDGRATNVGPVSHNVTRFGHVSERIAFWDATTGMVKPRIHRIPPTRYNFMIQVQLNLIPPDVWCYDTNLRDWANPVQD